MKAPLTVAAHKPRFGLAFSLFGKIRKTSFGSISSTVARVNGTRYPGHVDLALLFPDRRVGTTGGVEPGMYELAVDVGDLHKTVTVEAVETR